MSIPWQQAVIFDLEIKWKVDVKDSNNHYVCCNCGLKKLPYAFPYPYRLLEGCVDLNRHPGCQVCEECATLIGIKW